MTLLSIDELKNLVEQPTGLCVSIYMPTCRLGQETQQNPIRFKNLIRQAEELLVEHGLTQSEAGKFLQPAHDIDRQDFWQHQNNGLAIFVAEGVFHYYRLPLNFPELAVVTDHFHLKPLLPLLTNDGLFYILSLSQDRIQLLEQESAAAQRASTDIKETVPAAYYGRVEQLFVAVGVQQWGNFDPQNNTIELHPEPETGDEDLLDSAAVQTILNGGTVYAVEPEQVPDRASLAAVFRY